MRVQWITGVQYVPTVKYGPCDKGELDRTARGVSRTYAASDMCGPPANLSHHFVHPGYMHDVLLTALEPNTRYCYRYGSPGFKYSQEQSFVSAIKPGSDTPFKFVAYGDMDTSLPPGSFTTAALVRKDIIENGVTMVLHVGDLSYAVGLGYRWDEWMTLIEPYSTLAPYMIAIGNHEQEHIVGGEKDPSHHPGLMLLTRGILLVLFASTVTIHQSVYLFIILIFGITLLLYVAIMQPFKSTVVLIIQSSSLVNLVLLSGFLLYSRTRNKNEQILRTIAAGISIGVVFIQFCGIILFNVVKLCHYIWSRRSNVSGNDREMNEVNDDDFLIKYHDSCEIMESRSSH